MQKVLGRAGCVGRMVGEGAEGAHEPGDQEHGDETGLSSMSVTMLPVFGGALGPLISPVLMVKPRDGILVSWIRAWSCNLLKVTGAGYAMSCCTSSSPLVMTASSMRIKAFSMG